jgi:hypothetical protein
MLLDLRLNVPMMERRQSCVPSIACGSCKNFVTALALRLLVAMLRRGVHVHPSEIWQAHPGAPPAQIGAWRNLQIAVESLPARSG